MIPEIKAIDAEKRNGHFIIGSEQPDREGIIVAAGWKLDNFRAILRCPSRMTTPVSQSRGLFQLRSMAANYEPPPNSRASTYRRLRIAIFRYIKPVPIRRQGWSLLEMENGRKTKWPGRGDGTSHPLNCWSALHCASPTPMALVDGRSISPGPDWPVIPFPIRGVRQKAGQPATPAALARNNFCGNAIGAIVAADAIAELRQARREPPMRWIFSWLPPLTKRATPATSTTPRRPTSRP